MRSSIRRLVQLVLPAAVLASPLAAQVGAPHGANPHGADPHAVMVMNTDAAGVAIKGYDVVAYQAQGTAVAGSASHTASYHGATFRFASAANRDAFVAAPAKYLPQYGGYCAMGVAGGRKFDIDPTAFRVVDGRLYLNKDARTQRVWERDVPGNIASADTKWPAVASRQVER